VKHIDYPNPVRQGGLELTDWAGRNRRRKIDQSTWRRALLNPATILIAVRTACKNSGIASVRIVGGLRAHG